MTTKLAPILTALVCVVACGAPDFDDEGGGSSGALEDDDDSGIVCEPAVFESSCSQGRVVECSADGRIETRSCGPRSTCVVGSDGAGCVWRLGEPCESEYINCDDPGGVLSCEDGEWTFEACPVGGTCADDACYGPDAVACSWPDDPARCQDGHVVECFPSGFERTRDCDPGMICLDGIERSECRSIDAMPCDPRADDICLDENTVRNCHDGWTIDYPCLANERCFDGGELTTCYDATAEPCDVDTFVTTCEGGIARWCSSIGIVEQEVCDETTRCGIDESPLLAGDQIAACIPLDATPCKEPQDVFCNGDAFALCFDGAIIFEEDCGCTLDKNNQPTCTR